MAELIAKSPCAGLLPLSVGRQKLTEPDLGALTSIAPYDGKDKVAADLLKSAHGLAWPAANRATGKDGGRAIWFGRGQIMLAGPTPAESLGQHAAITDQSDAWAIVRLDGESADHTLARLVPVDLRRGAFKRGHSARTTLGHMMVSITRIADNAFLILTFRSMAHTLVHELETAMQSIKAREELT